MSSILVIDDKDSMRKMVSQTLAEEGYLVDTAKNGSDGIDKAKEKPFDLVITDMKMAEMDGLQVLSNIKQLNNETAVIIMTGYGTIETAVSAMKMGAYDFLTKPFDSDHMLVLVDKALKSQRIVAENEVLREELDYRLGMGEIIGENEKIVEVLKLVHKVAVSDTSVLLQGESGTGKELFARAIHNLSPRKKGPIIAINCAAIPRDLLENELFGSERGAFTGSVARKIGKFEISDGGTIFLDEIGDMDISLQAKLLRVLQEKTIERLGGNRSTKIDTRVIAATNNDLKELITQKKFREDLFYRLSVFPIVIPPLRDRLSDISALADHFIQRYCRDMSKKRKSLSKDALELMEKYHWPGNVRELENTIERAIILCESKKIKPEHMAIRLRSNNDIQLREGAGLKEIGSHAQGRAERAAIIRVLKQVRGNKRRCSKILKIDYTTLFDKIKKYSIDAKR
ncbi:MAG: sigma-54-dependent Fis family transcriptional regulator [candidate division Zixibacteria bacterium]|nr:sigma-54-dependent Fis family transcriptional regulator [candidate division Zixibacteria bacterium]